jgi:hypothetical protein
MKRLIPIPHFDNIPPYAEREKFCEMLDAVFGEVYDDIIGLNYLNDPLRCRSECLDALIEVVGGDVNPTDPEALKRVKAHNAQNSEYRPSLWKTIKNLIDSLTGASANIFIDTTDKRNDWGLQSTDTNLTLDDKTIVSQMMADANGLDVGLTLLTREINTINGFSAGAPVKIDAGVVLNDTLCARVKQAIVPQIPAYKQVVIGYFDGNSFIAYDTIF